MASLWTSRICLILPHKVNRRRVWFDGLEFRTGCDRCGTQLLRADEGWRKFDEERDGKALRTPHPRNR